MVKMIMALPKHVDGEKFMALTMDVIKGRYGKDGYYGDVQPYASWIMHPEKISKAFKNGFCGKNGIAYYEINAAELDPVIIATLEELGGLVGMDYRFVSPNKFLRQDWWKPLNENFQTWRGNPYYDNADAEEIADDYFTKLELIDENFKSPKRLQAEMKFA